jgi:hypothetical protein
MNESPDLKENEILKEFFTLEASLEGIIHLQVRISSSLTPMRASVILECLHISLDIGGENENTERG